MAALLALLCQLFLAAPAASASATSAPHICGAAPADGAPPAPMPGHKDCAHCPLCAGLAAQHILHANGCGVPAGRAAFGTVVWRAVPGGAPYRPAVDAARPRGPPALT